MLACIYCSVLTCARFEAIVPGNPELVGEYQNRLYSLETEEKLRKFMRYGGVHVHYC